VEPTALRERVLAPHTLRRARPQVRRHPGAPGRDGRPGDDLEEPLKTPGPPSRAAVVAGTYAPQPVRRTAIPQAGGGPRPLGMPTVRDRGIAHALWQVRPEAWAPTFAERSSGLRPQRRAQQAGARAQASRRDGATWGVEIDLEQFFDRVNHDVVRSRVRQGTGEARAPVRPLGRRRDHRRAESPGRGTGDGEGEALSGAEAPAHGH
jgi:retron-type reverse transcriptase